MLNYPRRLVCSVHMLLLYGECCRLPACQNQTDLWFSQRILTCSSYRQLGTNANLFFPLLAEKMVMSSALKSYLTFSCVSNRQPYLEQRVQQWPRPTVRASQLLLHLQLLDQVSATHRALNTVTKRYNCQGLYNGLKVFKIVNSYCNPVFKVRNMLELKFT